MATKVHQLVRGGVNDQPGAAKQLNGQSVGTHRLVRGDTWDSLAKRYGTTAAALKDLNQGLLQPGAFHGGAGILVPTLSGTQSSAYDLMAHTLSSWGLSSLLPDLKRLILSGDSAADTLSLALSQTDAYKQRFAANAQRMKNGLPELTPAQYIATEEQYRNLFNQYGVSGYNSQDALNGFLGRDVSPSELDSRLKEATDHYLNAPQEWRDLWASYGYSQGDALKTILDPTKSLDQIQRESATVGIGAAAANNGLGVDRSRAVDLQQHGVTLDQAQKAYQQIAAYGQVDQNIAQRFNTTFDQTQEENDLLLNQGDATAKRQNLYGEEEALFKGHAGANTNSYAVNLSSSL